MYRIILLITGWCAGACMSLSFAQEIKTDTLGSRMRLPETFLLTDTLTWKSALVSNKIMLPEPAISLFTDSQSASSRMLSLDFFKHEKKKSKPSKPILPFELAPNLNFHIIPSRWDVPLTEQTTSFAPTVSYQLSDQLILYGGISFTQYHRLSYVQSMLAPDWPVKSNITSQAFGGIAYALHDRITLHGTFQHSLYNPMPSNLLFLAPAYSTIRLGADLDLWNGLGVTVDRVWELDKSGRMRQRMQYSPYINLKKFLKFLGY